MKTIRILILAVAILGAAWILKPAPSVQQLSQKELQNREEADRFMQQALTKFMAEKCAAAMGKTLETLDLNDSAQEAAYRKCMWPEQEQSWVRRTWNRMISGLIW